MPLKTKYPKIKAILNDFSSIFDNLNSSNIEEDKNIIGNKMITFGDYSNKYYKFHQKLAEFFNENYNCFNYNSDYKNKFIQFIQSSDISGKDEITKYVNKVSEGTVAQFIEAYTGETKLCYSLNKWLRDLEENVYNNIKYFAGPFSYALYQFAHNDRKEGIYKSKTFYRKMTIKLSDYYLYKMYIGELICYPAFTSTSEKDISKYDFPTSNAIEVNNLTSNDISVVLIIEYDCKNSYNPTPCVSAGTYSVNSGENEFIFPPFSFFKITGIREREGKPQNPHIINMSIPNKKSLVEFELKNNKKICYNKNSNELYSSD
jgi:hypothetical protein